MKKVIIIGSGPAGLTAAIYAARANMNPLVISGTDRGGQVTLTDNLENYPGFPEGIGGIDMYQKFEEQAKKFGAEVLYEDVTGVDLRGEVKKVETANRTFESRAVIIATGSNPRKLNVPGEKELTGRGVSYCATCDGFFFKDKHVAVIGGGDSALDEGLFLTRFAGKVTIIHRRDQLRADPILQERAFKNSKVDFIWDTVVKEIVGDQGISHLKILNKKTDQESDFKVDGVFIFIGHIPNTDLFKEQIQLDESGTIKSDYRTRTNVDGVFACGDVQDDIYRQAVTAAGSGCKAAMEAEKYVAELEIKE